VLSARRRDRLEALAADLSERGYPAQAIELDVTDDGSIAAALDMAGPIDGLVNNAGTADTAPALAVSPADFDRVMATNLRGPWLLSVAAAQRWKAAGKPGFIINIASILGERVAGQVAPYAISKAGIIQMTKALALEWARHSIRINALAPGYFGTEINAEFFASEAGQGMLKRVPMRRLGQLEEIEGPFLLLASEASSFMTGAVIPVDGGHLVSSL
jgi:NAD(P)-dependent dehydrogenase (short-subunit alcohol dehydrogenase family)